MAGMNQRQHTPTAADLEPGTVIQTVDGWARVMDRPDRGGQLRIRHDDGTESTLNTDVEPFAVIETAGQAVTPIRTGPFGRERRFALNFAAQRPTYLTWVLFEQWPGRSTVRATNEPQLTSTELTCDDLNRLIAQLTELRDLVDHSGSEE